VSARRSQRKLARRRRKMSYESVVLWAMVPAGVIWAAIMVIVTLHLLGFIG
jgi:hypothetical protein